MKPAVNYGDEKKEPMRSPLATWERAFIDRNVVGLPRWLRSWQLTMLTLPFTAGLILAGWLARGSEHWLWLASALMAAQWWTDCMDGTLGRLRGEGLVKWGYYMDHLLDFCFMSAMFVGWALMLGSGPAQFLMLMLMLVYGAMMVSSWLLFGATQRLKIVYLGLGPTEVRLLFVVVNTLIIVMGKEILSVMALATTLALALGVLGWMAWSTQRRLWELDKEALAEGGRS